MLRFIDGWIKLTLRHNFAWLTSTFPIESGLGKAPKLNVLKFYQVLFSCGKLYASRSGEVLSVFNSDNQLVVDPEISKIVGM